jgi:uncharacterized protein YjbI with pentapeptide repeats
MANEEHLALLRQGVEAWNEWRENHNNYETLADLTGANLTGINMIGANLGRANLTGADLTGAYLNRANLRMANLSETNLEGVDLSGSDLRMANLRMANLSEAILTEADISGAYLSFANLRMARLSGANLSEANLKMTYLGGANLTQANLRMANLSGANLEQAQAINTNFRQAIFTGSCLENWQINRATNLDGVICDFVYLRHPQKERLPGSGNFANGEFTKLFQNVLDAADSKFSNETKLASETNLTVQFDESVEQNDRVPEAIQQDTTQPNLVEVAKEIQQLLQQIERTYPTKTPVEKLTVVIVALKLIESNLPLQERLFKALKIDTEVFKALVSHPLVNILLLALES